MENKTMRELDRVTIDPDICLGQPTIRGMRLTVSVIVRLVAAGRSRAEILEAYKLIAESEGIFCEPASAASVAGVIKLGKESFFRKGERIVCTLTGHGLKDPDNAIAQSDDPVTIPSDMAEALKILGF
ncbi:MAG: pyridoxal-phosphate dependent enzyme [Deltaproteobacteria bacterium]|nr:MAG: pyridoxal-phosphate dependent enzyme [Deltaproteobacteria bacterium]